MPLCNYTKVLKNENIYNYHSKDMHDLIKITGTAMLINRTDCVVIDVDNKGKNIEECKAIFDNLCKTFLPSPNSTDKTDRIMRLALYAE